MGLEKKPGLYGKAEDLRMEERYKARTQENKAIQKSFKSMSEEDEITGTASKGAGDRHKARIKKAFNKGQAQYKAINKAGDVDKALINDYGKFSRRARSLMRAATQTRAKKPTGAKQKTWSKEEISKLPEQGYKAMGGSIGYSQRWKTGREG